MHLSLEQISPPRTFIDCANNFSGKFVHKTGEELCTSAAPSFIPWQNQIVTMVWSAVGCLSQAKWKLCAIYDFLEMLFNQSWHGRRRFLCATNWQCESTTNAKEGGKGGGRRSLFVRSSLFAVLTSCFARIVFRSEGSLPVMHIVSLQFAST